jgi:chromatin remodeling complex protein RSC6
MSKSNAKIVRKQSGSKKTTLAKNKSKRKCGGNNEITDDDQFENTFESKKEDIMKTLKEINALTKKVTLDLKQLESLHKKELKIALKTTTKKSGKQSGINEPVAVPEPLQKLLGLNDEPLSRAHVTKLMYAYIKENKLYSPKTKRIIIPN